MNKIIYFDEIAATDYVDIKNGGRKNIDKNYSRDIKGEINTGIKAETKTLGILQQILNFGAKASLEASALSSNIVKTYISNTILTDFLNVFDKNEKKNDIVIFSNPKLEAYENSMTFLKMYAPYMKMLNIKDIPINITEIDSILTNAKGYYELIAYINETRKVIFRFNIGAFRNNYSLNDILKMDLKYYAIKVGTYPEDKLAIEKEFPVTNEEPDVYNVMNKQDINNELDVYDVILAGVECKNG